MNKTNESQFKMLVQSSVNVRLPDQETNQRKQGKKMHVLLHAGRGASAQQALQMLAHRQVQVKLRLPQLPGSGDAECDDAEMLGNVVKKGGGTKEVSGC